jgi:nitroreductase
LNTHALPHSDTDALERLLVARHSCRGFRADPVPDATIERVLSLAQRTASWCNAQPWQVVITKGAATDKFRTALCEHVAQNKAEPDIAYPREYRGRYQERRRVCGFQLYDAVGVARGDRVASQQQAFENFKFFGAPHVALISLDEALGAYGAVDCGAYVNNFMLAAESLGIATIAQASIASYAKFVRDHFGIGDDRLLVCAISFGYEERDHKANGFRTQRAPLDEVVTWVDG